MLSIDLNPGSCWISQENVEDDHAADSQQDHEGQNDDEGQRNKEKKIECDCCGSWSHEKMDCPFAFCQGIGGKGGES